MDCSTPGFPVLSPGACSNSCLLSWWCHSTILSSVVPFCSCLQSFPASGSFLMIQLSVSGGQSIGASASASVLPVHIQDWFPLELTDLISLLSKRLFKSLFEHYSSRHQFFGTQPFLLSTSHGSCRAHVFCFLSVPFDHCHLWFDVWFLENNFTYISMVINMFWLFQAKW